MCDPGSFTAILASASKAGTAAAGLAKVGTAIQIGTALVGGVSAYQVNRRNAQAARDQAQYEATVAAVENEDLRQQMAEELARQRLSLASRGVSIDSPSAQFLGRVVATRASKASQTVQSRSYERTKTLTAEARAYDGRARLGFLKGTLGAAGHLINRAPDIWPSLREGSVT